MRARHWGVVAVIVAGAVGYLPGLDAFGLSLDERIYFNIAREAAFNGHWLVPRYTGDASIIEGTVFLEKPPLVFWIQATSLRVFGGTTFAVRLPSVLAAVACGLLVTRIGARLYDDWTGIAAGVVFLVTPAMYAYGNGGRTATTDIFLLLFGTLFVWWVWRSRTEPRYLVYAGVAGGLAVMSKQAAFGVYLLVALPVLVTARSGARTPALRRGVAAGLLVVLPWNAFAYLRHPDRYVHQMLVEQTVGRIGTGHEPLHGQMGDSIGPLNLFYVKHFPDYVDPFLLMAALGLGLAVVAGVNVDRDERTWVGVFLCWWLLCPILLFTAVTSSTWIHYSMASVVPVALLSGYAFARSLRSVRSVARHRSPGPL